MVVRRFALLALTFVVVAVPGTASATGGYGAPQRVQACSTATSAAVTKTVSTADGSVWGLTSCRLGRLHLLHRSPAGTWSSRALPFSGRPEAVADDGRTTFFLFSPGYQPNGGNRLWIAKVPHGGTPSAATSLLASGSEEAAHASLVASAGTWWAVWDTVGYGDSRQTYGTSLMQARSMVPAFAPRRIDLGSAFDLRPHLALRGAGAVLAATRGGGSDGRAGQAPVFALADANGSWVQRDLGVGPFSTDAVAEDLTVAGSRTLLAIRDGSSLRLAMDDGQLQFTSRNAPTRATPRAVALAASGGRAFLAHSACFTSSAGANTCRAYVAEAGVTGPLLTTEVSAPFGRADPGTQVELDDISASRGRATVVTANEVATWSQTQG